MFSLMKIMPPKMRTRSAGQPVAVSRGGGTGERVGKGGRGRPRRGGLLASISGLLSRSFSYRRQSVVMIPILVVPRISALAGCDRLVSEPLVIQKQLAMPSHFHKKFCWGTVFATGRRSFIEPETGLRMKRTNRRTRVPIGLYPCHIEEKMTIKEVKGELVMEWKTKNIGSSYALDKPNPGVESRTNPDIAYNFDLWKHAKSKRRGREAAIGMSWYDFRAWFMGSCVQATRWVLEPHDLAYECGSLDHFSLISPIGNQASGKQELIGIFISGKNMGTPKQ
ncbi:hypothetical protein Tco_1132478 [Tanacetum coccineum]|uniref:Ribosomal protein L2 n=1 Tax=Tanacetum coccineum TaxID=301880 RepID=A0ABQ5JET4_9ASTR